MVMEFPNGRNHSRNGNGHHPNGNRHADRSARIAAAFQTRPLRYAHIMGWGKALPARIMPNDEFKPLVGVGDDWIYPRTGIRERRIAREGETTTDLATAAARQALRCAGVIPSEIDLLLVATSTPEYIFPSTASLVQDRLGAGRAGAADVSAACSGFMYALDLAMNKIRAGAIRTALVIGAETMSRVLDWSDRKTCVLFGDGAGALVLQGRDTPGGMLGSVLGSDGSGWDLLTLPTVNSQQTYLKDGQRQMHRIYMDGRCVFQFAVQALPRGLTAALESVGLEIADLDLVIPHQANQRILDQAAQALGLPPEKLYSNLGRFGNTSAASIPIALTQAVEEGRIQPGSLIGLVGFGGGLTWGAAVLEWGPVQASQPLAVVRRQGDYLRADLRRFWLRHYWRRMAHGSPQAMLRRFRRHRAPKPVEAKA